MKNPFYIEPPKPDRTILRSFIYVLTMLIIGLSLMLLSGGCAPQKRITEKPYIAVEVTRSVVGTHYTFINLNYTEGRRFFEGDTAKCNLGDTVPIREYRGGLFRRGKIVFILK